MCFHNSIHLRKETLKQASKKKALLPQTAFYVGLSSLSPIPFLNLTELVMIMRGGVGVGGVGGGGDKSTQEEEGWKESLAAGKV